MSFVLDCSLLSTLFLPDEKSEKISRFIKENSNFHVPSLFWFEINNVISVSVKRGRISHENTEQLFSLLEKLPIKTHFELEHRNTLEISVTHNLSSYDSSYLSLAVELDAKLATLDRAMILASRKLGVDTVNFE